MSVWQDPLVVSSQQEEDDLAKAIQLSLQENKVTLQLLYLKKMLRFLRGNFLGQLVLVVIIINHTSKVFFIGRFLI